jgi:FkbM family methyltransferase
MNDGQDTDYYLAKGFDVVAVEANPRLCDAARQRFAADIAASRLNLVEAALAEQLGEAIFHINLDNDHWSSIDPAWASRGATRIQPLRVRTTTIPALFKSFGVPHYMKVDIEGCDMLALRQLLDCVERPSYVSVEDCRFGLDYVRALRGAGYTRFKLSNQATVAEHPDDLIGYRFALGASGSFGEVLTGAWLDADSFVRLYSEVVRDPQTLARKAPPHVWWDIHAALAED